MLLLLLLLPLLPLADGPYCHWLAGILLHRRAFELAVEFVDVGNAGVDLVALRAGTTKHAHPREDHMPMQLRRNGAEERVALLSLLLPLPASAAAAAAAAGAAALLLFS